MVDSCMLLCGKPELVRCNHGSLEWPQHAGRGLVSGLVCEVAVLPMLHIDYHGLLEIRDGSGRPLVVNAAALLSLGTDLGRLLRYTVCACSVITRAASDMQCNPFFRHLPVKCCTRTVLHGYHLAHSRSTQQ